MTKQVEKELRQDVRRLERWCNRLFGRVIKLERKKSGELCRRRHLLSKV